MGMDGISKSQVSRLCGEIDGRVQAFLTCPIEGDSPYLWLDATNVKARGDVHIVSMAVIIAVGVNTDGCREVLGMTIGNSEAEPFRTEFLRFLTNARNRRLEPAYKQHTAVDDVRGVILNVEVTTGEANEGGEIASRAEGLAATTGIAIRTITADQGYAYGKVYGAMDGVASTR